MFLKGGARAIVSKYTAIYGDDLKYLSNVKQVGRGKI